MKILQVTKKFPYPLRDGESIAVNNLASVLARHGCTIDLLAMNTSKHPFTFAERPKELDHYREIYHCKVDNSINWRDAIVHLVKRKSYQAERFVSDSFERQLVKALKSGDYDIIQLESFYLSPYIEIMRRYSGAHIAMRAHNIEHVIWKRLSGHTRWGFKKWYLTKIYRELEELETKYLDHYDSIIAISQHDRKVFENLGYSGHLISVPIGLDLKKYEVNEKMENDRVSFIGTLDWRPNVQGLEWFMDEIWPDVSLKLPNVALHIAGRGAQGSLKNKMHSCPQTVFHGEVDCAKSFLSQNSIMIVPLLSGSGMRVKIIEGMAKGMLVITTSCGLEGIPAQHMHQVLIADTPEEFKKMIEYAVRNQDHANQMRASARNFVNEFFHKDVQGKRLFQYYQGILKPKKEKTASLITFGD